jgi:hypothetical protein
MNCQGTRGQGHWLGRLTAGLAGLALVLTIAACSQAPATATHTASPAVSTADLKVTSTLDGLTALPHRIHWQAFPQPPADVTEVDFLIDGKQLWVEHASPYFYGDDGNYLVTSFLTPGKHVFAVRAVGASGHVATDTVTATVQVAPQPPAALAGTWKGFVPQSQGGCSDNNGQPIACPPAGDWRLVITPIGWQIYDTAGGGGLYDVVYPSPGLAEIRTGMATGHPNADGNAFCNMGAGDRPAGRPPVLVRWTVHGSLLSFTSVGSQKGSCGFTTFLEYRGPAATAKVYWAKAGS